jgi:Transcriptional regulator, AbiEi antitoxin, Type IV TA system/Transcriptional regulator, AbiEi antitoxin N-terminal domain
MAKQKQSSINWLEHHLPEGLMVDAAWLASKGYSTSLRTQYVAAGWLSQPVRRVYQRPRGEMSWQQIVISLQTLLERDLAVGGRTALELHGYAHYLSQTTSVVYLYGPKPPPTWLTDLGDRVSFLYRNDGKLFNHERVSTAPHSLQPEPGSGKNRPESITARPWGQWNWPLMISSPERAVLEILDELPGHESFHQIDMLMEGQATLSPARLQKLLVGCRNVKVKRLFFFFADRHQHAWLKRLDRKAVDLGQGKRVLVKGGRYDAKHQITVPRDLDGAQ